MKNILFLIALMTTTAVSAQKQRDTVRFDLQKRYDLWPSDGKLLVQDVFKLKKAQAIYPDCFKAWEREKQASGMTLAQADAWIMGMTLAEAAYFDALWKNADWSANSGIGRGLCLSRNFIVWPVGTYYTRDQLDYGYNIVRGTSNSSNYEPTGEGGTVIKLWNEKWRGDPKNRVLFGAYHGGTEGSNSYSESAQFSDLRLDGGAGPWKDSTYTITGLQAWDFGSGSEVHNIFICHCDIGLDIVRGTPFMATGNNAVFECNTAAVALTGASGATITFSGTLESDDCPTLFLIRNGWDRPAGGMLNVQTVKVEWAISSARVWKPETIVTGEGWMDMNFGSIHYATGNVHMDALFNLKGDVNTSFLHVGDIQMFAGSNVQALLHDDIAKETWMYDVGWTSKIKSFDWYCDGQNSQLRSWPMQADAIEAPHQGRLGYLIGDPATAKPQGEFDRVNGLPTWSDVTGTSQAPVAPIPPEQPSGSSEVIADYLFEDGTVADIEAEKGENMVQPTEWMQFTSLDDDVLTNTNGSATYPVNWVGVTKVTIKGLTWSGDPAHQVLFGSATASINAYPDGSVVDSRNNKILAPAGAIISGKPSDLSISIDAMDVTYFGGTSGTGNAWKGSMGEMAVYGAVPPAVKKDEKR